MSVCEIVVFHQDYFLSTLLIVATSAHQLGSEESSHAITETRHKYS